MLNKLEILLVMLEVKYNDSHNDSHNDLNINEIKQLVRDELL